MTLTQNDFNIIMKKLDKFEEELKKLEKEIQEMKPLPYQVKYSHTYALKEGDLSNAGFKQQWRVATDNEDIEE